MFLEESEAWVTGGVDFSRTAGDYCPLGHCPTGTSLCFGENFGSIGTWVWLLSCQIYFSRFLSQEYKQKGHVFDSFCFSFWDLDFVCCLFRVLCSIVIDTQIPNLTSKCWNSLKHWWLSLSVEPYSSRHSPLAIVPQPVIVSCSGHPGQWCFWKHHPDTVSSKPQTNKIVTTKTLLPFPFCTRDTMAK